MNRFARILPIAIVVICGAWLGRKAVPPRDAAAEMKIHEFGRLPVVYQGRVKPFDTLARNALTIISEKQTFLDDTGAKQPAIEWLLDVISGSHKAEHHRVFRIANLQLQSALGLEARSRYRYALHEFQDKLADVEKQYLRAVRLERAQRDIYDTQVMEFMSKVMLYRVLKGSHQVPQLRRETEHFDADLRLAISQYQSIEQRQPPHAVPPKHEGEEWRPFTRAALESIVLANPDSAVDAMAGMFAARAAGDVAAFNSELAVYSDVLAKHPLAEKPALRFEALFNNFAPFYHCAALYVIAFLISCIAWLGFGPPLIRTATWLLTLTFAVHTAALAARVYISGYPPITNLYGTAVFIGWGCVLLGLILESIYRLGVGNILASVVGFATLIIAHFLAGDGDTLQMMQAVLDTKFWLATHVIVINFGYSATFLAGCLAVLFILRGVLTRSLDKDVEKAFGRMIYGTLCFALLLSFVGTVLGGLWADDSWGRFWGWDPKENGALMIVLWNALILHARWAGLAKVRGIAVLAIFGSIITAWSWFGVNQLGVGLHSYGFTDSVAFWLILFALSQLIIMGVGMLPRRLWRSAPATKPVKVADKSPAAPDPDLAGA